MPFLLDVLLYKHSDRRVHPDTQNYRSTWSEFKKRQQEASTDSMLGIISTFNAVICNNLAKGNSMDN